MSNKHKISEYIDSLTFRKSLCMGFQPDEVYEAICNLTSMYNEVLAEAYDETDRLKEEIEFMKRSLLIPSAGSGAARVYSCGESREIGAFENKTEDSASFITAESVAEKSNALFDRELADMLSMVKQPDFCEPEAVCKAEDADEAQPEIPPIPVFSYENADDGNEAEATADAEDSVTEEAAAEVKKAEKSSRRELSDREIQRLKRGELLEILIESSKENERLRSRIEEQSAEISRLNNIIDDRKIKINKAGTLAEAALSLNGVFESAQAAAQQYLDNLQELYVREEKNCVQKEAQAQAASRRIIEAAHEKSSAILSEAEEAANKMKNEAQEKSSELEKEAQLRCNRIEQEAKMRCDALEQSAREGAQKHWDELSVKLEDFYRSHSGLQGLLASTGYINRG